MSWEDIYAQFQQLQDENAELRRENTKLQRELAMANDLYEHLQNEQAYR
ncbi:hypothetical protein [Paenibacillus sabinae]|uniref:Uncharacterized protein n=1 Tax=Paenibacillus sabinae T27 TaxID=1268072 RepID=X4Z8T0_9BACL|nr:hypothetical protein [Paenibacillus sabinae]AHV96121.1 hypothetical protein PSAB_05925 [Paenibacillus sabinae T27]